MRFVAKILVGLSVLPKKAELSIGSTKAIAQARWLAEHTGAELVLWHSTWTPAYGAPEVESRAPEALSPEVRERLEGTRAELAGDGFDCRVEVSAERPGLGMTRAALRGQADLVVVGKRDEGASEGRRLGSTAVKLVRKCPVPVWLVKPEHDQVHKLILAATDLTQVGDRAVAHAAWVAEEQKAALHVVHAYPLPTALQLAAGKVSEEEYAARVESVKARAQSHIDEVISKSPFDGDSAVHLSRKPPFLAIREAGEHLDPDLLVMGSVSHGGVAGHLVGTTAERLIDRVECSLLLLKPSDFVCPVGVPRM